MTCFHPLQAYRDPSGGAIKFKEGGDSGAALELPCGRCIGCRKSRTSEWTTRIMNEASLFDENSFVTLTYNEEHHEPSLKYEHFQDFIRKLRRKRPVRFYAAGEYGDENFRPHWHAILFGVGFKDTYPIGKDLVRSHEMEKLWARGGTSIGEVNHTTAGYVAAYCIKKITGPKAEAHYTRLDPTTGEIIRLQPEMARMSLKPGIGARWYEKFKHEVHYARDGIVKPGGTKQKTPRYYDKILERTDKKQMMEIETNRQMEAITRQDDNTTQRLKDREIVAIAAYSQKQRKL